nr:reverse transcriptase domain-containing protein [Tanacetum cinerariifolium]
MNTALSSGSETLPSKTVTKPKEDLKGITTRSGIAYKGPTIPTTSSPLKVVERETEVTKDTMSPTNNESTKDVQPPVVQVETQVPNSEPVVASIVEPVEALSLLTNKEKLFELARTPLNEHFSAVLLQKLPEKLGDPDKFLIPCDFQGMDECLALADLGASINLMPLSVWKMLSLPELSPTCMTLKLTDQSISRPIGVTEDVSVKTGRVLIDVYEGELTLRVFNKTVTFNLDQTSRYSSNCDDMSVNRIDIIDVACEEYSQEVLGFFEGDILLIEEFHNDDPSSPPLPPQELKVVEPNNEKSSIDEPPVVELKDLPPHLEYAFFEGDDKLPVIIAKDLKDEEKSALIKVLKSHKMTSNQWFNKNPQGDQKGGGFTVVENEENELIPTRLVTRWRVCIDYKKLNDATRKDHFPLPFMDEMLKRLAGNEYYYFLDGFSSYFQIPIDPQDQENTTFTCPYGTFTYRRMPFGLCNAPGTFQRCMMAIFYDMIEKTMEVFMDDFLEKSHFMVKEGIVLGHKISKNGIEVDKAKVDVTAKLPHPTTVKGIRSFLGHAGFYRRFIQDFSKISRLMTRLLEKDTPFFFSKECIEAFQSLKKKLTEAPILVALDWDLPFELM